MSDIPQCVRPTRRQLFTGFLKVGLIGFGGVMPHARRMLVEDRRWLDDREFTEMLSLGQCLPGPNIVNVSIVIGQRFQGRIGSLLCITGLMLAPLVIVLMLATVYERFSDNSTLQHALEGVAAAAAGFVLATGFKLFRAMPRRNWSLAILVAAFLGAFWFRFPLLAVLAVLAPISIALAWHESKRGCAQEPTP